MIRDEEKKGEGEESAVGRKETRQTWKLNNWERRIKKRVTYQDQ